MKEAAEVLAMTPAISWVAWLPAAAVATALAGAGLVALAGARERLRSVLAVGTCGAVLACLGLLYGPVFRGFEREGEQFLGVTASIPGLLPDGMSFRADAAGLMIALVTAFIWLLATIFATSYMKGEHARVRFDTFLLITLAGDIGVLMAGDFVTLFVFFEIMALASYVLVVHGENPQSMRAGSLYLYMSVAGGLVLLGGIAMLAGLTGSAAIAPAGEALKELPAWAAYGIPLAMIVGFGTKAGMFFLHVWLPEAHPVAPSPASALLSGLMVKVGVYGILRTANFLLIDGHEAGGELMHFFGLFLIAAGVATMVSGMASASFCSNCKELLAYSTISQVGYILVGLGCAAYLGADGALALGGALFHVLNHAMFKAAFFLAIGAVMWRAREQVFSRLGGLARKMPWTAAAAFIAMLSIIGMPGTAGFASKSLLHHAVIEVIAESAHLAQGVPDWRFLIVDALFVGTAAGTFAYSTRMFILVFLGKTPEHLSQVEPESWAMRLAYAPLMALIVLFGFLPNRVVEWFIGPALAGFGFETSAEAYHALYNVATRVSTLPILYDPQRFAPFSTPAVTENLLAVASSVFFAGTFYMVGHKIGVFDMPLPRWWSLAHWYRRIAAAVARVATRWATAIDAVWDRMVWVGAVAVWLPSGLAQVKKPPVVVDGVAKGLGVLAGFITAIDRVWDRMLAGAFVDAWLSEPSFGGATAGGGVRLTSAASWAAEADRHIDAAVTNVMMDAWMSSEPETTAERAAPVAAARAEHAVDAALTSAMVDAWMPAAAAGPGDGERKRATRRLSWSFERDWHRLLAMAWRAVLFALGLIVLWMTYQVATGRLVIP